MRRFVMFGLLLAGGLAGQDTGWRVWVKVSPCSGIVDWITVAKDNPTGGGKYYESADRIKSPLMCGATSVCTFDMAFAEKAAISAMPQFFNYCCKDYSVIRDDRTQELFAYRGWTGRYGFTVVNEGVCCQEAAAITGKVVSACPGHISPIPPTGGRQPAGVRQPAGGRQPAPNTQLTGTRLTFYATSGVGQCQSDCARNNRCKGFTLIEAGTYNASDPAMCYLLSDVTGSSSARGYTSGMGDGSQIPGAPAGPVITTGGYRPPPEGAVTTGSRPPTITTPPPTVNPPTRPASGSKRWALVSTTATPEKRTNWSYTAQSPAVQMQVYNGDHASFQWTPPPPQFDTSGFTITLNAQSMPAPKSRMNVLLCVGSDRGLSTADPNANTCAEANGQNGAAASKQQGVQFKPDPAYDEMELRVEMMWSELIYRYKYRKVQ